MRELTSLSGYGVNSEVLDEFIKASAKENPQMQKAADLLNQGRKEAEKLSDMEKLLHGDDVESAGVTPIVASLLMSMTEEDYANEVTLLDVRYRQIEAACREPYPQSTADLKALDGNWTTDDAWKKTKLLKWFQPRYFVYRQRLEGEIRRNAMFCLAVTLKWQRDHGGRTPENLADAFAAIGLNEVPVDPFSGEPLKIASIDNHAVIYSVGPDGDDDHAAKRLDVFHGGAALKFLRPRPAMEANPPPDGDIVFQLGE